jgi:hypothetical protein
MYCYAECHNLCIVIMLIVVMLSVIMLNVVAPQKGLFASRGAKAFAQIAMF